MKRIEVHRPSGSRAGRRRRSTGKPRLTTSAMIASIAGEGQRTKPAPFGHALAALAETRPDIVGLTADLGKYTDLHIFAQAHPDRFYQMGMAEQLLMSAAAGMAREGFMPFATTYAVFAARRAYDFISMAIAEENLQREDRLRPAGAHHRLRPEPPGDRGPRDLPRHAEHDDRSIRATRTRSSRPCRRSPPTPARSTCACCAATCRWCSTSTTTLRARQGEAAARRHRRADHLVRLHDHARARSRRSAARPTASTRRAARADDQAARRGDDPARKPRAAAGWWSSPRTTPSSAASARRLRACCCAPA